MPPHAESALSTHLRSKGASVLSDETESQNFSSFSRARSRPPSLIPDANTTAFIVPALAPLIAEISMRMSSASASSTPQV